MVFFVLEIYVDEWLMDCKARRLSPKTIKKYNDNLTGLMRYLSELELVKLSDVNRLCVKSYCTSLLENGRKASYVNCIIKSIKAFYSFLEQEEYIKQNTMKKLKLVREDRLLLATFSDKEVVDMIRSYDKKGFLNIRNKVILEVFADTGMRAEELRNVKNKDIVNGTHFIIKGKGGKERIIPISDYLLLSIKRYNRVKRGYFNNLRRYREIEDYLFVTKSGNRLKSNALLEKIVRDACKIADVSDEIKRKSCHTFRHYYAQKLLMNSVDLYTISRLLGHSSVRTTQIYLNSLTDTQIISRAVHYTPLATLTSNARSRGCDE